MTDLNLETLPATFVKAARESTLFTPDIIELEHRASNLVFVYNECQENHYKRYLVDQGRFCGTMFTVGRYTLFKKRKYVIGNPDGEVIVHQSFPIMVEDKWPRIEQLRVKGEVWAIDSQDLTKLDDYMLNGVEFERTRIEVVYPHFYKWVDAEGNNRRSELKHSFHMAYAYVGIGDYWNTELDVGFFYTTCRRYEPRDPLSFNHELTEIINLNRYYSFNPVEYSD